MDRDEFNKILDDLAEWQMALHSTYTTLKAASSPQNKQSKLAKRAAKLIEDEEIIDEDIDDSESNQARHKESQYPVVFRLKPVKTTCDLCKKDVISQVFSLKILGCTCTRKCSICRKSDEMRLIKKKRDK